MKDLLIDCPTGLSGDMLLASLLDLGVPKAIILESLDKIGLSNLCSLEINEYHSHGFRGLKTKIRSFKDSLFSSKWEDIEQIISQSSLAEDIKRNVLTVYNHLAISESKVHGTSVNKVHFHELASIDSFVNIIGVCAAYKYLQPRRCFCNKPPAGSGVISSSHGEISVPAPVVVELAKTNQVELMNQDISPPGELTTPTGLALMIALANFQDSPKSLNIQKYGIGFGSRKLLDRPNYLRSFLLDSSEEEVNQNEDIMVKEKILIQEAWIDDLTSEELSIFVEKLRDAGAIEVVVKPLLMKKGRSGFSVQALVRKELVEKLRIIWFSEATTLGLRERVEERFCLLRRKGYSQTIFGRISSKQTRRPNDQYSIKAENTELVRLSKETGKSILEIKSLISLDMETFHPIEDWTL